MVGTAISTSLSGLKANQAAISVLSNNIANAHTEGFARKEVTLGTNVISGTGQGVTLLNVSRIVDTFIEGSIRKQSSILGKSEIIDQYYDQIQNIYGTPNSDAELNNFLDRFFSAFSNLATNPELPSVRLNAINEAQNISTKISNIATSLHELRFEAENDIAFEVSTINKQLNKLFDINVKLNDSTFGEQQRATLLEARDIALRDITERINLHITTNNAGQVTLTTGAGATLLDSNLYSLQHTPVSSVGSFISDSGVGALTVVRLDDTGAAVGVPQELASAGKTGTITHTVQQGKLRGLLEIRDVILPELLTQLDSFAQGFSNAINAVHNDGAGFPPPSSLTGTTAIALSDTRTFAGDVRIAVLNPDGTPVSSHYPDEDTLRPITLELSKIDSGNGIGSPSVQDIIDEINYTLGPPVKRVAVGGLYDVGLVAVSNNINPDGTFEFDFQLDNNSAKDITFEVLNVDVTDAATATAIAGGVSPLPSSFTVDAGKRTRTSYQNDPLATPAVNNNVIVDFSGGAGGPYTVRAQVRVTDGDGNITVADLDYVITDNVTNIRNDHYEIDSFTNVSGTAPTIYTGGSQNFVKAELVDSNGKVITDNQEQGYLRLTTNSNKNYVLALDELDSKDNGLASDSKVVATGFGFSHFFGLNNLFVDNGTTAGSAVNFALRSDIKSNPNLLSRGDLTLSNQPVDTTQALYTYELSIGNNNVAERIAGVALQSLSFAQAGKLPASELSIGTYAADITGFTATEAFNAKSIFENETTFYQVFEAEFQSISGVNIDEELANTIKFQTAYNANAKVISVANDLLEILLDSL